MKQALVILTKLIKESEGCKLTAYRCPAGRWTVGYGCTGPDIKEGTKWTQEKADAEIDKRAIQAHKNATKASPCLLLESPSKRAAIADFIYNVGYGAYCASTLKKHIDAQDWAVARNEIMRWNKATANGKAVVMPGLVIRRGKEADLLLL